MSCLIFRGEIKKIFFSKIPSTRHCERTLSCVDAHLLDYCQIFVFKN